MYGPVAMRIAENWPMVGSLDELSAYAESKGGGMIPTEPELRLFSDRFNPGYEEGANVGDSGTGTRSRRCSGPCFVRSSLLTAKQSYCWRARLRRGCVGMDINRVGYS